jgi:hypothetical protein
MYGGLVIILMLTLSVTIGNLILLINPQFQLSSKGFWSYLAFSDLMYFVIPIFFLFDGFLRTKKCLKEGESISKRFVLLIIGAYGS